MESQSKSDIDRVGLSEESRIILDELVEEGHFKDALSAYRLAISSAILCNEKIEDHEVNRPAGHMYLISQLDPDQVIATVIEELFPQYSSHKYRMAEKFADKGVRLLKDKIEETGTVIFWEENFEA